MKILFVLLIATICLQGIESLRSYRTRPSAQNDSNVLEPFAKPGNASPRRTNSSRKLVRSSSKSRISPPATKPVELDDDDTPVAKSSTSTPSATRVYKDDKILEYKAGKTVTGENGTIKIDGQVVYENDKNLKKGWVRVEPIGNGIYVNGNLVLKMDPNSSIQMPQPHIDVDDAFKFTIQVSPNGQGLYYEDANLNRVSYNVGNNSFSGNNINGINITGNGIGGFRIGGNGIGGFRIGGNGIGGFRTGGNGIGGFRIGGNGADGTSFIPSSGGIVRNGLSIGRNGLSIGNIGNMSFGGRNFMKRSNSFNGFE